MYFWQNYLSHNRPKLPISDHRLSLQPINLQYHQSTTFPPLIQFLSIKPKSVIIHINMKFIKQSCRKRAEKDVLMPHDQNIPHNTRDQPHISVDQKLKKSEMEIQGEEFEKKEQQIYERQIIQFLVLSAKQRQIDPTYFRRQSDITEHMRAVLINWLIDVHIKYRLQPQTLFMTIHLIDTYLGQKQIHRTQLQLVGIAALWIAAKYEETYQIPKVSNLVHICDSTYSKQEIMEMQGNIISVTRFDILKNTPLHYYNTVNRLIKLSEKDYYLGRYMLELCLFEISIYQHSSKVIACSIIFFINKLRRRQICWSTQLTSILAVSEQELKPCARIIFNLWQKGETCDYMASLKKKYSHSKYKQVAKIKIGASSIRTSAPR